ncbi:MAG TPA: hypothetical protein VN843_14970 [Anaerolineales bacterium]|nr:hypothetical protein [Anaerolineales bacterium]
MNKILVPSVLLILISGCQSTFNQTPNSVVATKSTPTISNESVDPTSTVIFEPSATPFDSKTTLVPTAVTGTATPTPLFRDDFDSVLEPGWEWINEDPSNWSLSKIPDSLQFNVIGGHLIHHNISNLLLRLAPAGNFQIETHLLFTPVSSDQFAGLILYDSELDFIQAGVAYCNPVYGCIGKGIYMDIYMNGVLHIPRAPANYDSNHIYLRLIRQESTISLLGSSDDLVWFSIKNYETNMRVDKIGIVTGQNLDEYISPSATFEYFEVSSLN